MHGSVAGSSTGGAAAEPGAKTVWCSTPGRIRTCDLRISIPATAFAASGPHSDGVWGLDHLFTVSGAARMASTEPPSMDACTHAVNAVSSGLPIHPQKPVSAEAPLRRGGPSARHHRPSTMG